MLSERRPCAKKFTSMKPQGHEIEITIENVNKHDKKTNYSVVSQVNGQLSTINVDNHSSRSENDDAPLLRYTNTSVPIDTGLGNQHDHTLANRHASAFSCYINLTSTLIGAGLLGMPYGFSHTGWILGFVLLTLCGISSGLALYFLTRCAKLAKYPVTFYQVAELTIPRYSWLIDLSIAIKCYGVGISYLIIVGDLMPAVMHSLHVIPILYSRFIWVTAGFIFVVPLTFFEHLDSLKYTSGASIMFVFLLVGIVIMFSIPSLNFDPCSNRDPEICYGSTSLGVTHNWDAVRVLPVFIFGYTCHQNTFVMVNEMASPSQRKFNAVIFGCILTAWLIYVISSSCGYVTYGNNNTPDLLKNYPETVLTNIARVCVSAIVLSHFPLQAHPCRRSLLSLLQAAYPPAPLAPLAIEDEAIEHVLTGGNVESQMSATAASNFSRSRIITTLILLSSYAVAVLVHDLGLVISLVGATGSLIVSYVLPGLCYYNAVRGEWAVMRHLALLQFITGLVLMVVCTVVILSTTTVFHR